MNIFIVMYLANFIGSRYGLFLFEVIHLFFVVILHARF
jgi:hypothetical protein